MEMGFVILSSAFCLLFSSAATIVLYSGLQSFQPFRISLFAVTHQFVIPSVYLNTCLCNTFALLSSFSGLIYLCIDRFCVPLFPLFGSSFCLILTHCVWTLFLFSALNLFAGNSNYCPDYQLCASIPAPFMFAPV